MTDRNGILINSSPSGKGSWSFAQTQLLATSFLILGLPDGMLGVLWPSIGETFGQALGTLGVVLTVITVGAALSSLFVGRALRFWSIGFHLTISASALVVALISFIAAPFWIVFLLAAFLYGLGAGGLDSGVNAFAASHRGTRFLNQLHAVYGVGITVGPLVATLAVAHGVWRYSYAVMIPVMVAFAIAAWVIYGRFNSQSDGKNAVSHLPGISRTEKKSKRFVVIVIMTFFFLYAGLEITTGSWAYTFLTKQRGLAIVLGGLGTAVFWGSLTTGRLAAGIAGERISLHGLLTLSSVGALAGVSILVLIPVPVISLVGLLVAGFFLGPFFPTLVSAIPLWVGKEISNTVVGMGIAASDLGMGTVSIVAALIINSFGLIAIIPLLLGTSLVLAIVVVLTTRKNLVH